MDRLRPSPDRDVTLHRWDDKQFRELLKALKSNRDDTAILTAINDLKERMEELMATQEDRLKGISTKISEVLQLLADLKVNNPDIEDEITEIETKLAGANPTPEP